MNPAIRPVSDFGTYLKLALVSVIWGGTFIAGRLMSSGVSSALLACLRFILAALVLVAILIVSRRGFVKITLMQALRIAGLGFFGIYAYNLCFFYGLSYIGASRASLIVASNPAVMAIFAYLFFKEKISPVQTLGLALCLLGAGVVILGKSPQTLSAGQGHWLGDVLICGCVLSWVVYSVFCRNIVREIGALHTVAYSVIAGAVMLTATAIATGQMNAGSWAALSSKDLLCLVYLGALGSAVAYVLYYDGIRKIGSTRAGSFIALNPATAVLAGVVLLGEPFTLSMCLGGVLVVVGILLSNRAPPALRAKAAPQAV